MNVLNILNNPDISDIPILYILRVIHAIQKENSNEQPSSFSEELSKINERVKR